MFDFFMFLMMRVTTTNMMPNGKDDKQRKNCPSDFYDILLSFFSGRKMFIVSYFVVQAFSRPLLWVVLLAWLIRWVSLAQTEIWAVCVCQKREEYRVGVLYLSYFACTWPKTRDLDLIWARSPAESAERDDPVVCVGWRSSVIIGGAR